MAAGRLARVAHGLYCAAGLQDDLGLRVRAAMAIEPTAVVTGRAAAALAWWPELAVPVVQVSRPRGSRVDVRGIRWHQGRVPDDLVLEREGIRIANPALSTLDLVAELGGQPIDEALRRGAATLPQLEAAFRLTPGRPGNVERAWLLRDSRDEPWSEAERHLHRTFRGLHLPYRYSTNHPVTLPGGAVHPIDVAVPDLLLGFEVDGHAFHHSKEAFERDRHLEVALAAVGWQVVRLSGTGVMADETPGLLRTIIENRAALLADPRSSRRPVSQPLLDSGRA